jgi:two-component system, chemotaxis family, protein-glutamate methylesterase/glutaminase
LEGFVNWLQTTCLLKIKIALDREVMQSGIIYMPQENCHLMIRGDDVVCSHSPPYQGHCPSVTIMMQSVAQQIGESLSLRKKRG